MAKKDSTENRVWLFESLANAYVTTNPTEPGDPRGREKMLRAFADFAFVSATVADGGDLKPSALAAKIEAGPDPKKKNSPEPAPKN